MTEISFSMGMMLILTGWAIFRLLANGGARHPDWKNEARQLFFLINLLVIARFTFYPFDTVDGKVQPLIFEAATAWPFRVNLVPLVNLLDYESRSQLMINVIGNTAMFIPTGIMVPLIYKRFNSFPKVALFGAALSLAIELIQLPFAVRASDVDDLILNTAGCALGYGIYAMVRRIRRKK